MLIGLLSSLISATALGQTRSYGVEDLLSLEDVGEVALSPDGAHTAFVRERPLRSSMVGDDELSADEPDRSDVWIASGDKIALNITNGGMDQSSCDSPAWSPEGDLLAFACRRGPRTGLWIWSSTGSLKRISESSAEGLSSPSDRLVWIDNQHVMVAVVLSAVQRRQSVRVLDSSVPIDLEDAAQSALLLIDVASGRSSKVSTWPRIPSGSAPEWRASSQPYVAHAYLDKLIAPSQDGPLSGSENPGESRWTFGYLYKLKVLKLDGSPIQFSGEQPQRILGWRGRSSEAFAWQPGAARLLASGFDAQGRKSLFLLDAASGLSVRVGRDPGMLNLVPGRVRWPKIGDPIVEMTDPQSHRRAWHSVKLDESRAAISSQNGSDVILVHDRAYWLTDGKLVSRETGTLLASGIAAVVRTNQNSTMLAFYSNEPARHLKYLDFTSKRISTHPVGPSWRQLSYLSKRAETLTLVESSESEKVVKMCRNDKPCTILATTNDFIKKIDLPSAIDLYYSGNNGQMLRGQVLFPPHYDRARRYPVLTWVYNGLRPASVADDPGIVRRFIPLAWDYQVFLGAGYVVFIPQMPIAQVPSPNAVGGEVSDQLGHMAGSVVPGIDELIAMGVADPDRLFLLGISHGGFSVNAMLSETGRFKAAVSGHGISDTFSSFGSFNGLPGRTTLINEGLDGAGQILDQTGMGTPPWEDPARYLRNNPIVASKRIYTPLLIVSGEDDYIQSQQQQEMFSALMRQGKPARLLTFRGESHTLESPTNIRRLWAEIFAWFDRFGGQNTNPRN
ncbi:prolyl oligopeptidase family serine peptidase [Sphingomonas sp.]|uniref:S9 family peptidase n=1 Tax=Sphingomonas sp. TaxID=28214 RepID=UPI0025DEBC08|nr:prolyl oligopeptidase family serine peptidase [Sphingomonas sp.]